MHSFTFEIRRKGTPSTRTIEKSFVAVRAECTGQHADVAENALRVCISDENGSFG